MTTEAASSAPRPPGRPRSARADEAIAQATLEAILEDGIERMSMEGVASRAGVSKATLYRRCTSKEQLIAQVVTRMRPPGPPPDMGSFEADMVALIGGQRDRTRELGARLVPRILSGAMSSPVIRELLIERFITPFRDVVSELVRRGIERGELREDLDVESAVDFLHGSLVYRLLLAGGDPANVPADAKRLLPTLMAGLST